MVESRKTAGQNCSSVIENKSHLTCQHVQATKWKSALHQKLPIVKAYCTAVASFSASITTTDMSYA